MKTIDEKIEEIVRKQDALKAQENHLRQKKKQMEKAEREKRLISIGKAAEDALGRTLTADDLVILQTILEEHAADFSATGEREAL